MLVERRYRLPLQALEPVDLEGRGDVMLMLLNPTGGLLGGDRLDTQVRLGAGSRVCLTTPSASRVYRATGPPTVQRLSATVGEGATLEYVPDHLIPSPGARLVQTTEVSLADGAIAILADAWVAGRIARGEAWQFSELDMGLVVRDAEGLIVKERVILAGRPGWDRLGAAQGCPYVGTFLALGPGRQGWSELADALAAAGGEVAGVSLGVTPLPRDGLLARVLAPGAPALRAALDLLWARSRRALLGLPPLDLRKL